MSGARTHAKSRVLTIAAGLSDRVLETVAYRVSPKAVGWYLLATDRGTLHRAMDLSVLERATSPVKLDVGCGAHPLSPEWIGIDAIDYPQVHLVGDALDVLSAITSESIDEMYSSNFLEHIDDLDGMLREMARVLKVGGKLTIRVPHWSNPWQWSDPTHRRTFGLYTLDYLVHSDLFAHPLPDYQNRQPLQLEDIRLTFRLDEGFGWRTWGMRQLQTWANRARRNQEFFEVNLAQIVGCDELRCTLRRIPA